MKSKSEIKMIIESLYDLGVIQKRKKRKKKRVNKGMESQPITSASSSVDGTPKIFQNTSNLQNEYMREQLLGLENSNAQRPHFRELENQIENNRIFQNQTQRALLYLHNQSNPIIEEIGYDDDDNIDVAASGGSDIFENAGVDSPVVSQPQSTIFSFFNRSPVAPTPTPLKSFAKNIREQMDANDASPYNSDKETPKYKSPFKIAEMSLGIDSDDEPKVGGGVKRSYNADKKKLLDTYKAKGGNDPTILRTTTKKTIEVAIKNLDDLAKYQNLYENILGGEDENLISGDLKTLGKLKAEVKRRVGELNKGKKDKTKISELLSRR